jgi:hypothetical protein
MMRLSALSACALVLLLSAGLAGCQDQGGATSYEQQVMQARVQRDMEMREKGSVIPPGRKAAFRGLNYFPVDSTYRYVVPLTRRARPDTVRVPESTGSITEQVRVGHVEVPVGGAGERLTVFRVQGGPDAGQLWVPFTDPTNGDETYRAGRYVDLRAAPGDSVVVDFNRAYNPTCAYNPGYACPLPPPENRVATAVPAGEKKPSFRSASSGQPSSG